MYPEIGRVLMYPSLYTFPIMLDDGDGARAHCNV
jgi:hypothetical protein